MSLKRVATILLVLASSTARGQSTPPASAPPASAEERLRRLEAKIRELEARQPSPASAPSGPISNLSEGTTRTSTRAALTLSGYVEMFYQWSFNDPSNGITAYRGFDDRHNSLTISNAVLDATGSVGPVSARLALQVGHTPESYYLGEPSSAGAAGVGPSGASVWKHIQQANLGWRAPLGRGLLLEGGIFLSPIGPEGMAVKDQWNWSRSTLFFGLPFYHTGLRATYPFTDRLSVTLAVYNGWNSVVDNNAEKSIAAQLTYSVTDRLMYQLLYFTGVEWPTGAVEGRAWRHLLDSYVAWYPRRWLSLLAHVDAGFERNARGISWWAAGALYARVQARRWLYLAARGDLFGEGAPSGAARIFWPADWVASGTATIEARPHDNLSLRLEYRHDHAAQAIYFRGQVSTDAAGAAIASSTHQDTLTLGVVAWF